jgi:hypothetical protein
LARVAEPSVLFALSLTSRSFRSSFYVPGFDSWLLASAF